MKKLLLAVVAMLALNTGSALAETKGYDQKTVIDNDRVRVMIVTWKPGAESPSVPRELDRVIYAVKGGTIVRKYEDGTTKKFSYKDGDVVYADKPEVNRPGNPRHSQASQSTAFHILPARADYLLHGGV